jgi:hypothetical protein
MEKQSHARDTWYEGDQKEGSSTKNTCHTGGLKKGAKMAGREKTAKIKPTTVLFVPSTKGGKQLVIGTDIGDRQHGWTI